MTMTMNSTTVSQTNELVPSLPEENERGREMHVVPDAVDEVCRTEKDSAEVPTVRVEEIEADAG